MLQSLGKVAEMGESLWPTPLLQVPVKGLPTALRPALLPAFIPARVKIRRARIGFGLIFRPVLIAVFAFRSALWKEPFSKRSGQIYNGHPPRA